MGLTDLASAPTCPVNWARTDASLAIAIALCVAAGVLLGILIAARESIAFVRTNAACAGKLAALDGSRTSQADATQFRSPNICSDICALTRPVYASAL